MRGWIEKITTAQSLWAFWELSKRQWPWLVGLLSPVPGFLSGAWEYVELIAKTEGPFVYWLVGAHIVALPVAVTWAVKSVVRLYADRKKADLSDPEIRTLLNSVQDARAKLTELKIRSHDKERHLELVLLVERSDHAIWLGPDFRSSRQDFVHWSKRAQEDGSAFKNWTHFSDEETLVRADNAAAKLISLFGR